MKTKKESHKALLNNDRSVTFHKRGRKSMKSIGAEGA